MLQKICNFYPSSHILAILGTKMVQKWDFLKNPAPRTQKKNLLDFGAI